MEAEETVAHDVGEDELIECLAAFKEDPPLAVSEPHTVENSRPLSEGREARCSEPLRTTSSRIGDREAIGSSNAVLRFELVSVRSFRVIRNAGANGELARYLVSQICSHLRVAENDAISLDRYQEACSIARKCVEPRKNVIELIPYTTLKHCRTRTTNARVPDSTIVEQMSKVPSEMMKKLLPFQKEGVRYALERGGRCLIADEMGLGKTLQAITTMVSLQGFPTLVIAPASLRLYWAEEMERWVPDLSPHEILAVTSQREILQAREIDYKVVITSYQMLGRHINDILLQTKYKMIIVDESHMIRCSTQYKDSEIVHSTAKAIKNIKYAILLTGTPCINSILDYYTQVDSLKPGLLGSTKYTFGYSYCTTGGCLGKSKESIMQRRFKGSHREYELNVLLSDAVMIRRLKKDLLAELPAKRRQIIRISDDTAVQKLRKEYSNGFKKSDGTESEEGTDDPAEISRTEYEELGNTKVPRLMEWLKMAYQLDPLRERNESHDYSADTKAVIFAYHMSVLDRIQIALESMRVVYRRIDGKVDGSERSTIVREFREKKHIKFALVSISAGGVGLDFSVADAVVFAELPRSASLLLQAEDRVHRRGKSGNSLGIYYIVLQHSRDECIWQHISKKFVSMSKVSDGKGESLAVAKVVSEKENVEPITDSTTKDPVPAQQQEYVDSGKILLPFGGKIGIKTAFSGYSSSRVRRVFSELNSPGPLASTHSDAEVFFEVSPVSGRVFVHGSLDATQPWGIYFELRDMLRTILPVHEAISKDDSSPSAIKTRAQVATGFLRQYLPKGLYVNFHYWLEAAEFANEWNSLSSMEKFKLMKSDKLYPITKSPIRTWKAKRQCRPRRGDTTINNEADGVGTANNSPTRKRKIVSPQLRDLNEYSLSFQRDDRESWYRAENRELPLGCEWKTVRIRQRMSKKFVERRSPVDDDGNMLCRQCFSYTRSRCKYEMTKLYSKAELFCSVKCFHAQCDEWKQGSASLRRQLFKIEHGVCQKCGIDAHDLFRRTLPLGPHERKALLLRDAPSFGKGKILDNIVHSGRQIAEGLFWHADHIRGVVEGGGLCTLDNLTTLCVPCHVEKTSSDAHERAQRRKAAKAVGGADSEMES